MRTILAIATLSVFALAITTAVEGHGIMPLVYLVGRLHRVHRGVRSDLRGVQCHRTLDRRRVTIASNPIASTRPAAIAGRFRIGALTQEEPRHAVDSPPPPMVPSPMVRALGTVAVPVAAPREVPLATPAPPQATLDEASPAG